MSYIQNFQSGNLRKLVNGANFITLIGLWITVYVIVLRFYGQANMLTASLTLTAIVTDFLDGYYARKYDCVTAIGAAFDGLKDKILIISTFWFILISYWESGVILSSFFTATIVSFSMIELSILTAAAWGLFTKRVVSSIKPGKNKMITVCMGMISWVIFYDIAPFGMTHTDLFPSALTLFCFFVSLCYAWKSLPVYWIRYFGSTPAIKV